MDMAYEPKKPVISVPMVFHGTFVMLSCLLEKKLPVNKRSCLV